MGLYHFLYCSMGIKRSFNKLVILYYILPLISSIQNSGLSDENLYSKSTLILEEYASNKLL